MLRIDPLTENGSIDVEFFAKEDYPLYRNSVERYLKAEGFELIEEPIVIQMHERFWSVYHPTSYKT